MAKRSKGVPQEPGYVPYPPPKQRVLHRLAENGEAVAYTEEEYGVRKDDGLGLVEPVNSSGGLLFLSILITLAFGGMLYGLVQIAITGQWEILGRTWWMFLLIQIPLLGAWAGYFKERKAEKLRRAKNLPRPVE
ncbi:hypothetical protein [Pseudarthrobacter sp. fls2-241-R2A-127]|uniref:hypothetical protein n=1 Tax=Pseudarthrobacter sp. fls2-241-R2A-127 TaxID=3040303 RepID=UPI0025577806|nr:hypothetical protein [Pseudarthrobacter sp. fls2-241-R2A-127]